MDKPWREYINNQIVYLDNTSYLNLLFQRSHDAIRQLNRTHMRFLLYDFEEIRELDNLFYSMYKVSIDAEINTLQRFLQNANIITYEQYQNRQERVNNI
jgi:hypothetical protein